MSLIQSYVRLVTFSHTIFAMPFAVVGFFMAIKGYQLDFRITKLIYVLLCMVFARNAAMAFNRYADRRFDAANPRTAQREIPAGKLSPKNALIFITLNVLFFILCAYLINPLCFALSPVALIVILGYSLSKRFTYLCHYILGIGLGLAPLGAFLAVSGFFSLEPILLALVVLLWVSSFDIIYALQDEDIDQKLGLQSIPAKFGNKIALLISRTGHLIAGFGMVYFLWLSIQKQWMNPIWAILSGLVFIAALIYQHNLVQRFGLSKVNMAFFTTNGIASVAFAILYLIGLFLSI
jgi:4-hydroxybenzoate polyprenyltransferase